MHSILKLLRAVADATRLRILSLLEKDELSVREIQEITGMGQSRISTHLGQLLDLGLVQTRREGKRTYYSLHPEPGRPAAEVVRLAVPGARDWILDRKLVPGDVGLGLVEPTRQFL